jgi:ergothioneine biosynthesis protein EgtB
MAQHTEDSIKRSVAPAIDPNILLNLYTHTRNYSLQLCQSLSEADIQAQSMSDASPLKWHLAHTSWAFETFVLKPFIADYQEFDTDYDYLFNSYYNAIGKQYPRAQRGLLTRPSYHQVLDYRLHVDQRMQSLLNQLKDDSLNKASLKPCIERILLAVNHEQQHQELMLTDIKHLFSFNPINPKLYVDNNNEVSANCEDKLIDSQQAASVCFQEGLYCIGHRDEAFHFDNEGPQHQYYLASFKLDSMLVSNADYSEFIDDGGYQNPLLWLSEAWQKINSEQIQKPLYWQKHQSTWFEFGLSGLKPLKPNAPLKHISFFEANAYANWKGKRLPTEQEWEVAARSQKPELKQMFNQLWQWTSSSYSPYPGFKPAHGAIGEYNGKFMLNQYVLRGGSVATPSGHIRPSYRNFFYADARWQYSGIRLAEDN